MLLEDTRLVDDGAWCRAVQLLATRGSVIMFVFVSWGNTTTDLGVGVAMFIMSVSLQLLPSWGLAGVCAVLGLVGACSEVWRTRAVRWLQAHFGLWTGAQPPTEPRGDDDAPSDLLAKVRRLPTHAFTATLEALSVAELKRRLRLYGIDYRQEKEKSDLVGLLRGAASASSCQTCAVCLEDFTAGDILRFLPRCRHAFHLECFDRWVYSSAARVAHWQRRSPHTAMCPLCKTLI